MKGIVIPAFVLALASGDQVGSAAVKGKASFKGTAPKRRKIDSAADRTCHEQHKTQPLLSETVIVNENGTLRNVFVYVKSGLQGKKFDVPGKPVVLDQKGCRYDPHVQGIMVGQKLVIRNSDDTMHNVHATPQANAEFNFSQARKGQEGEKVFTSPEVMVPFKCDVHGWMGAYLGVVDNPFFAVTGQDGAFELKGLPAGEYTIGVWHEKYGTQEQKVKVGDGETKEIEFAFGEKG